MKTKELKMYPRVAHHLRDTKIVSPVEKLLSILHLDMPLLFTILLLTSIGLFILYSASNQNLNMVEHQVFHLGISLIVMFVFAQIPPSTYQRWAFWIYLTALVLLICVMIMGHIGKGAQRWLNFGFIKLQPSELMKLAIPMVLAWHFHNIPLPL